MIVRRFKTKWGDKFQLEKITQEHVIEWFNKSPEVKTITNEEIAQFLQVKSNTSALLVHAKTKQEYKQIIKQILQFINLNGEPNEE